MRSPHISEDVLPLGEFRTTASKVLKRLRTQQRPIVITHNGRPAAVLITPEDYDRLYERGAFLDAIDEGLADIEAGRFIEHEDLKAEIKTWSLEP